MGSSDMLKSAKIDTEAGEPKKTPAEDAGKTPADEKVEKAKDKAKAVAEKKGLIDKLKPKKERKTGW